MKNIKIKLSIQYILKAVVFLIGTIALVCNSDTSRFYEYHETISFATFIFMFIFGTGCFLKREKADESAAKILAKVNNILVNTVSAILLVLAFMIGVADIIIGDMSIMLMAIVALMMGLKAILFIYYDRKGLQNGGIENEYKTI